MNEVLAIMSFGLVQRKWKERDGAVDVHDEVLLKAGVLTTRFMR